MFFFKKNINNFRNFQFYYLVVVLKKIIVVWLWQSYLSIMAHSNLPIIAPTRSGDFRAPHVRSAKPSLSQRRSTHSNRMGHSICERCGCSQIYV